ncbi:MAG: DUF2075 domain-containing protein [Candidatus Diapherotrites archaeon]|nr:DUF2075 domain-containing protein [Candidatus Diapherotrites archaeon]
MKRVKTGIEGLDELLLGGIPEGSSVLVSGGPGTGKTILGMQYVYRGAESYNEPGVFVTVESNLKNITWNMVAFDWNIRKMQEEKLMSIYRLKLDAKDNDSMEEKIDEELDIISSLVKEIDAKRLVVDSTTPLGMWFKQDVLRNLLYHFVDKLKELDCTTLLIAETRGEKNSFSAFGVEEFVVDGVVMLYFTPPHRSIFVRKMRGTDHDKSPHPFEIGEGGVSVKAKETVLWEAIK